MGLSFKDNLEEQNQRSNYKKSHFWGVLIISFVMGLLLLGFLGFFEIHWIAMFFYVPNFGDTSPFYFVGGAALLYFRWWWKGIPSYIYTPISIASSYFSFGYNRIVEFPYIGKMFSFFKDVFLVVFGKLIPQKHQLGRLKGGKKTELDAFFYPKVNISDELPRVERFVYFRSDKSHIGNYFNYDSSTGKEDKEGTNRIIMLFRDHKTEMLEKRSKSKSKKISTRAKEILKNRKKRFKNKPSPEQVALYKDLFEVAEGMITSYKGNTDKIRNVKLPSLIKMKTKVIQEGTRTGNIKPIKVTSNREVDVVREGRVLFSIDMLLSTTMRVSILYRDFIDSLSEKPTRMASGDSGKLLSSEKGRQQFEDFFKFMFFRRILLNYGSLPSGWYCGRIEDYNLRAIVSAIDRPLVPTISPVNDGSNSNFNSDVMATAFLVTYWSFLQNKEISTLIDDIDWSLNTTKDLNEVKAMEASREEAKRINEDTLEIIKENEKRINAKMDKKSKQEESKKDNSE